MKKPILFFILFLSLFICNCTHGKKMNSKNINILKYEKIYVFDNKIDTIIKNYKAYKLLTEQGVIKPTEFPEDHDIFVTEYGSTYIHYLRFHKDLTAEEISTNKKGEIEKIIDQFKLIKNNHSEINRNNRFNYNIDNNDSIHFKKSLDEIKSVVWYFDGKIFADSIVFFVHPISPFFDNEIFRYSVYPHRTYTILKQ